MPVRTCGRWRTRTSADSHPLRGRRPGTCGTHLVPRSRAPDGFAGRDRWFAWRSQPCPASCHANRCSRSAASGPGPPRRRSRRRCRRPRLEAFVVHEACGQVDVTAGRPARITFHLVAEHLEVHRDRPSRRGFSAQDRQQFLGEFGVAGLSPSIELFDDRRGHRFGALAALLQCHRHPGADLLECVAWARYAGRSRPRTRIDFSTRSPGAMCLAVTMSTGSEIGPSIPPAMSAPSAASATTLPSSRVKVTDGNDPIGRTRRRRRSPDP